jgi:hypothetical protein
VTRSGSSRLAAFFLCASFASGQILIDTIARGKLRSGVPALGVILGSIQGITKDAAGNILFCEDHVIRRVRTDGTIETVAGIGTSVYGGDASLFWPRSPRFDSNGNLFFINEDNVRIRWIDTSGIVTTLAGTGGVGTLGANGPATAAQIGFSIDLAIDSKGNVYFSQGSPTNQIKLVTADGNLETFAGVAQTGITSDGDTGPAIAAHIRSPGPLSFDGTGNLYVAEPFRIRRVASDGTITKFAGYGTSPAGSGDGGQARNATFLAIAGLAADPRGNVYVADQFPNGHGRIQRIATDGTINTIAGVSSGSTADGPASQAQLTSAFSLFADNSGNVFFADGARLRVLTSQNHRDNRRRLASTGARWCGGPRVLAGCAERNRG